MTESLITISIVAFIAGFILSMPIAGPISILITSNALKGRMKYCTLAMVGASIGDFVYVFIAVFGLTKLYSLYKPIIPYTLIFGAVFLSYLGFKIVSTKINIESLDDKTDSVNKKINKERGGFLAGFLLNFLNPTLFMGWLTSSFIIISFVSSMGFNMGGLDNMINKNVQQINHLEGETIKAPATIAYFKNDSLYLKQQKINKESSIRLPNYFPLMISIFYASFVSLGGVIWFYYLSFFLVKYRTKINIVVINRIIQGLGIMLCCFGLFLAYSAAKMFL
ncbi:MAG: LysE family transporter [Bacteroidota bacterium]